MMGKIKKKIIRECLFRDNFLTKLVYFLSTDSRGYIAEFGGSAEDRRKMHRNLFKYGCVYDEYFLYGIGEQKDGAKDFITDIGRYRYCEMLNTVSNDIDFDDKSRTYAIFGKYYGRDVQKITCREEFDAWCSTHSEFIVKPMVGSFGRGIRRGGKWEELSSMVPFVVEDLIEQSPEMAALHPSSVNTVRISTIVAGGRVHTFYPLLKMGRGGSVVDNAGAGGILCGIDEEGVVMTDALDKRGNVYVEHPDTHVVIRGFRLPDWDEAVSLCKEAALSYDGNRFISFDIAHTVDRGWVMVEANARGQFTGSQMFDKVGKKRELDALFIPQDILFITDTYYPDSGATTTIARRTAEALSALGHKVSVFPSEISGVHLEYPDEHKGVKILGAMPDTALYDCVFSVAVNFEVNFLAHDALQPGQTWFPMSYDPYAFDPHITEKERQVRLQKEAYALKDAKKIFFLREFGGDYPEAPFRDKIVWFNLPCVREIAPDRSKKVIDFDPSYVNCVFLGDFYLGVENTDFIFRLFEKLGGKIRLYTIGNLGDYGDTVELWKERLGERYICHSRISQAAAHNVILDCDVLVSMGHDSPNMCPSKAIDFASSGKPVLHIAKIKDCCAQKYLERYPNKHCIYQGEELSDERVSKVRDFILGPKERIPFEEVKALYRDFTMEALIDKIIKVI